MGLMLLYLQCYFISIATILGTGILGLPVTLYRAGFFPFLFTFTLGFIMQVLVICLMVEVLQYCKLVLSDHRSPAFSSLEDGSQEILLVQRKKREKRDHVLYDITNTPTNDADETIIEKNESEEDTDDDSQEEDSFGNARPTSRAMEPNLHIIGSLFLHRYVQPFFMLIIFFNFLSTITSYALAGSEAYGQVVGVKYTTIIPIFTWTLSIIIITARQSIRPIIAIMTLAKGSLLFATVVVTLYAGAAVNHHISDDWKAIDKPFLMGTVALGGVPLVMPMLFDKFDAVRDQMKGFRNSLVAGMTTCFVLNVIWCWTVLKIVPQSYKTCQTSDSTFNNNSTVDLPVITILQSTTPRSGSCDPDSTLQAANDGGQISTVPLTKIIESDHKELAWIALVVQFFIVISITVSFLTIGSAMQHTICGWVDDFVLRRKNCKLTGACGRFLPVNWFWHYTSGLLCFSLVFIIAMLDPKVYDNLVRTIWSEHFGAGAVGAFEHYETIIESDHKELAWIALVVQFFIVISITVSFLTIGSAMQHTICGWVDDFVLRRKNCKLTGACGRFLPVNWFWHYTSGLLCFSLVFIIAMLDPKGFVSILEKLASFGANSVSGIFMFLIVRAIRSRRFHHIRISLPSHPYMKGVHNVTLLYFSSAVIYDVIITILNMVTPRTSD